MITYYICQQLVFGSQGEPAPCIVDSLYPIHQWLSNTLLTSLFLQFYSCSKFLISATTVVRSFWCVLWGYIFSNNNFSWYDFRRKLIINEIQVCDCQPTTLPYPQKSWGRAWEMGFFGWVGGIKHNITLIFKKHTMLT